MSHGGSNVDLTNLNNPDIDVYGLEGFSPTIVDEHYLADLGVETKPSEETLEGLRHGSELFLKRLEEKTVIPRPKLELDEIDLDEEPEIHNYTGRCPTLTYEINPTKGCNVGCLYCLVTDGVHEQKLVTHTNYDQYVRKILEDHLGEQHYYYFSPKTEALQEPTLQTGMAHKILREFVRHYEQHPDSKARLFIASKGGARQLRYEHEGESIIDLFVQLKDRMQFNTSVSMMPSAFRSIIEPYAAPIEERLEAVRLCQERGVMANSALVQPIVVPYLTQENIEEFFYRLHRNGIINYKPEFLTLCMENLAMLGQILGYFDKNLERELYEYYIAPENADHRKQRGRTAPNRTSSIEYIKRMMAVTDKMGMSISICYWVRQQLGIDEETIPLINRNGFQCLGYQSRLFDQ